MLVVTWSLPDEARYRTRVREVQSAIRREGIDILVTSGSDTRRYLGGVDGLASIRPIWLVVPADGEAEIVSPRLETAEIRTQSWIPVTEQWVEWNDPAFPLRNHLDALNHALDRLTPDGTKVLGADFYQSTAASIDALRGRFGTDRVRDASDLLITSRLIKDDAVQDVVRRAGDIAVYQYEAIKAALQPGLTEWEVARIARDAGMERAAYWLGDQQAVTPVGVATPLFQSGRERAKQAHGLASTRVIEDGDIVQVCLCGMPLFGHSVGFDRPLHAGTAPIPDDVRHILRVAEDAQAAALAAVAPGKTAGDIHAAAYAVVEHHGLVGALRHRTGRGLGSSEVEFPELKHGDDTILQPGMIFAVEPGIYAEGITSARFGDTVLVTDDGYDILTDPTIGHDL
jgi:Xaa-Pro aminopeptidase